MVWFGSNKSNRVGQMVKEPSWSASRPGPNIDMAHPNAGGEAGRKSRYSGMANDGDGWKWWMAGRLSCRRRRRPEPRSEVAGIEAKKGRQLSKARVGPGDWEVSEGRPVVGIGRWR